MTYTQERSMPEPTKVIHSVTYEAARFLATAALLAARHTQGVPLGGDYQARVSAALDEVDCLMGGLGFAPKADDDHLF